MVEKTTFGCYMSKETIRLIDETVLQGIYRNKSHAAEELIKKGLRSIRLFGV